MKRATEFRWRNLCSSKKQKNKGWSQIDGASTDEEEEARKKLTQNEGVKFINGTL